SARSRPTGLSLAFAADRATGTSPWMPADPTKSKADARGGTRSATDGPGSPREPLQPHPPGAPGRLRSRSRRLSTRHRRAIRSARPALRAARREMPRERWPGVPTVSDLPARGSGGRDGPTPDDGPLAGAQRRPRTRIRTGYTPAVIAATNEAAPE